MTRMLKLNKWYQLRPTLIGVGSAYIVVLIIGIYVAQAPANELSDLIRFLSISSVPSLLVGYFLFVVGQRRLKYIRLKILLAYGLGIAIAIANIYVTSTLMFLNDHDFTLLGILLVFASILSVSFGFTLASGMTESLNILKTGAQELAEGHLATRISIPQQDELSDVASAFNTMAANLEASFQRQQDLEQSRRDLIAAVSHDLRTPLTSARAMVEALADKVVTDEEMVARYHHNIQHQIANLSALIDDLFELSKIDNGRLELRLEGSNLGDLISDTLESMRAQAIAKNISLTGEVAADMPPSVLMDSSKVQRVLYNLVQNAIRHTPEDGTISIAAKATDDGILVDVIDTGEGIAEEDLPRIFDGFYRGEKSRSRSTGGAGLGLAIARGIIEAHGGKIWVNTQQGQGTSFSFLLPQLVQTN